MIESKASETCTQIPQNENNESWNLTKQCEMNKLKAKLFEKPAKNWVIKTEKGVWELKRLKTSL